MDHLILAGLVSCIILLVLSLGFIAARLYVRWWRLDIAGKDDLYCLISGIFNIIETVFMFWEIKYGAGKSMHELSPEYIKNQRRWVYISIPPYLVGLCFIKASIVYQYRRFVPPETRRICYLVLAIVVATTITFVTLAIFQCTPIHGFWDMQARKHCVNLGTFNYALLAFNSATDLMLLVLPMPTFMTLRLRSADRKALMIIFGLGGFAAATSIARIPLIAKMERGADPIKNGYGIIVWTRVEMGVSIICACLPCLRPLLAEWFPRVFGHSAAGASSRYNSSRRSKRHNRARSWFSGLFSSRLSHSRSGDASRQRSRAGASRLESTTGNDIEANGKTIKITAEAVAADAMRTQRERDPEHGFDDYDDIMLVDKEVTTSPSGLGSSSRPGLEATSNFQLPIQGVTDVSRGPLSTLPTAQLRPLDRKVSYPKSDHSNSDEDGHGIRVTTVTHHQFDSEEELRQPQSTADVWSPNPPPPRLGRLRHTGSSGFPWALGSGKN